MVEALVKLGSVHAALDNSLRPSLPSVRLRERVDHSRAKLSFVPLKTKGHLENTQSTDKFCQWVSKNTLPSV